MCFHLAARGMLLQITWKQDQRKCGPLSIWKTYSFKMGLSKIGNLEHRYEAIKTQFPKKVNEHNLP
jgi:hypothetical protein